MRSFGYEPRISYTEEVLREKLQSLAGLQKIDLEIAAFKKSAEIYPKQIAELEKEASFLKWLGSYPRAVL